MSKDYTNSSFKKLLDKLQQESWQLELLISGFAIFGLFSAIDSISIKLDVAQHDKRIVDTLIWFAAKISCWILIANLLIHVILRGLWIGALGLRYVSGDIDYDELKYSPKFTKHLQKRIGSFDKYIATLENYCSILFAVSFLFIFYFLASFAFVILLLVIATFLISNDLSGVWENVLTYTGVGLIIFTLIGMALTFIDFITQGFLKKKKWTTFFYFPIYKVFSYVTLAFLYRPLVYNFLDNKFGRRLSWILVPVYVGIIYTSSYYYVESNYLDYGLRSSKHYASKSNYEDLLSKQNEFIRVATIPSKVITEPYLKIFIVFDDNVEGRLFSYNPGLKPKIDERGYTTDAVFFSSTSSREINKKDSLRTEYFKTFNEVYQVYIDNILYETEFVGATNSRKNLGFESYVDIKNLTPGKHLLKITRKRIRKKDTANFIQVRIPFWSFKTN
ncbi:hypothetical protein AAON49_10940 [Pseudotenacibaculum sp. MALMAid0570]|uniref:hypothetical protein n=1 Tax=Pseudotenacibaculum sp. MALMAid0570 TaxID=3143938 RepID=UPI0032DE62E1